MTANKVSQKKSDAISNKVIAVISVCLAGVLVLMSINRLLSYGASVNMGFVVIKVVLALVALCTAFGFYRLFGERENRAEASLKVINGVSLTVFGVIGVLIALTVLIYGLVIIPLYYVLLPALAVYYLVYYSYQPEFFLITVDCGVAIALLAVVRRALLGGNYAYLAMVAACVMIAIALLQLVFLFILQSNKGEIKLGSKKYECHLHKNAYLMLFATPILMAVLVAAGAFMGVTAAFMAIGVAAAFVFVSAVYYTVKLM